MPELHRLAITLEGRARIVVLYIEEAHARDEWPAGEKTSFCDQPKTLAERCARALECTSELEIRLPIFVDNMRNEFSAHMGAWPFRFFIVEKSTLKLKSQPDPQDFSYNLHDITAYFSNPTL